MAKGQGNKGSKGSPKWEANTDKGAYQFDKFKPRTDKQKLALETMQSNGLTFLVGEIGTGKTLIPCYRALELYQQGKINRIIVTRPAVEAGPSLGFLPGTQEEKMYPYLLPILDNFGVFAEEWVLKRMLEEQVIEVVPVGMMRGRTFHDAFIIVDEGQNLTKEGLRMILTRVGDRTSCAVTLDRAQIDIKRDRSCVDDLELFRGEDGIGIIEFTKEDIVRSPLSRKVMEIYAKGLEQEDK